MANDIRFNPIRGKEEIITSQAIVDGSIYFATDTGKIFIDAQGQRNLMGGSGTSVLYSQDSTIYEHPNGTYIIDKNTLIDSSYLPRKDDLVINSDGRFFKVISANEISIICDLIAVSGTGGGTSGGGTPGGDPAEDPKVLDVIWHDMTFGFIAGQPYYIEFTATSKLDRYLNVEYRIETEAGVVETKVIQTESGKRTPVEVGSKMSTSGSNAVYFTISSANSYSYTKSFKGIKSFNLKLEQDNNSFTNYTIYDNSFTYYVNAYGQVNKILIVNVDDENSNTISLGATDNLSQPINIDCTSLSPGVHTLTAYLIADGVPSNPIVTDFIYHPADTEDAIYALIAEYPSTIQSYEMPIIKYWVYNTAKEVGGENIVNLYINNELIETVTLTQAVGSAGEALWPVGQLDIGTNVLTIEAISDTSVGTRSFEIEVIENKIFDPITTDAVLLLDAKGRSNATSLERRKQWSYKSIAANLNNFNWYNNGWVLDENSRSCLRISNGASVDIPLTLFTDSQPSTKGFTIEFEFKPYNVYNYTLLAQNSATDGEDENVKITRTFNPEKASIKYVDGSGTSAYGFCYGAQDAYFRLSDGSHVTARYTDEQIMNVTFVIDAAKQQMFIYINGIMSGMSGYSRTAGELPLYANKLEINSEFCDIDLYNIRIYNQALSSAQVVQNYISSSLDLDLYKSNQLSSGTTVNLSNLIEYNKDNPDNATIPYAIITTKAPDILPYYKVDSDDDATIVDIEFTNPTLDYKFNMGQYTEDEYLHKVPSFKATNVIFNVQGTSSQKYPRKNFKAKFKKATITCTNEKISDANKTLSKIYLDSNIGEKTFTWKADYMDSSGCHNTGFASFSQKLYKKHPLDYYENTDGTYAQKYRTTIYGFPMLVFHKKSDNSVEFIGKYNFNLDKGCDDTLGFTHDGKNKILDKPYEDVAECWEFGNNQGGRCSFRGNPFDYHYDYENKKYLAFDQDGNIKPDSEGKSDLGDDLEVRYHSNDKAIEGAMKNLSKPKEDGGVPISSEQAFNVLLGGNADGTGRTGAYKNLEILFNWLKDSCFVFNLESAEDQAWLKTLLNRGENSDDILETDEEYKTLVNNRKNKFKNEFSKHLNLEYCLVYYIMTELLIQYDSRGKNMMLGSWGPMEENGEYIWFPMYYDIDTQLGVDNSGVPSWDYNVEPSKEKHFSTSNSILWTCFGKAYENDIQDAYVDLRSGNLKIDNLNGYYNFDPSVSNSEAMSGILPLSFINADQYYKYIAPAVTGYIGLNDQDQMDTLYTSGYYYCLQGTRDLYRAQFLRNRFNYYDSMWHAGSYNPQAIGSSMRIRITKFSNLDELNTVEKVTLTPKLDQYVSVWLDESATKMVSKKAYAGEEVEINFNINGMLNDYDKQLVYLGGPGYLSDFGDLSLLYINELDANGFPTSSVTNIHLGNEHDNYSNPQILEGQVKAINGKTTEGKLTTPKKLLQSYDLTNLSALTGTVPIDTAEKLQTFKALGTNINNVEFAPGVALKHLYLPETVNKLELVEAYQLDKIVYNKSDILDEDGKQTQEGMYIANVVHTDATTNCNVARLNTIKIIGGAFDLSSYDFIKRIAEAKIATKNYGAEIVGYSPNLALHLENVHWTPYALVGEGAIYDNTKIYKYANNNFTYSDYSYNASTWAKDIAEQRIYEYNSAKLVQVPTSLNLLDAFFTWNGETVSCNEQFTNITTTAIKNIPTITGELFVNNAAPITEYELATKYNQAFPDLVIRVANVTDAYRMRFENEDGQEIITYRYNDQATDTIEPNISTLPIAQHYDFDGWYMKNDPNKVTVDVSTLSFSEEVKEYVLVLKTKIHNYNITFIDGDGVTNEIVPIAYNNAITPPSFMPYKNDDTSLAYNEVYAFKGWSNDDTYSGGNNVISNTTITSLITDLSTIRAKNDMVFYSVYAKDSVYNNVLDAKYFDYTIMSGYQDLKNSAYDYNKKCVALSVNSSYQNHIKGKITIPLQYTIPGENEPCAVISITGFMNNRQITHCFFENLPTENIHLKTINNHCFSNCINLQYIELPLSLRKIGLMAFYDCDELSMEIGNDKNLHIGGNIYHIGQQAFAAISGTSGSSSIYIGAQVEIINDDAFRNLEGRTLKDIVIGTSSAGSKLQTIGKSIFENSTAKRYASLTVYGDTETQAEAIVNAIQNQHSEGYVIADTIASYGITG